MPQGHCKVAREGGHTPRRLKGLVGETLVVPAAESAEHHETHGEESARLKNQAENLHLGRAGKGAGV